MILVLSDRTSRVHGHTVTASSKGTKGLHSTSDLPATPTPLAPGFHHGTSAPGSSTQPPAVPFRSQLPFQPFLSYTPVLYEAYESAHPEPSQPPDTVHDPYLHTHTIRPRIPYRSAAQEPILEFNDQPGQIGVEFFYQMVGAALHDSSCSTHGYSHANFGVSSSEPYIGRPVDKGCEGDRGFEGDRRLGKEHDRVQALHIEGEADEGGDDDQDESEDARDEEQPMPVAPVAHASGSDGRPHHRKGKGLTGSFMSMMSKISRSRNKKFDVARETGPADGGPVDPELIPSYGGHVAGLIWHGQDHGSLKCRSRYMALTGWDLTDA
ncbi:hypothetical protein M9H77_34147 [Catharanthus roseus]|uniref:Uncharacterized protein n=1 Tax=Catharanthus roseus TaxID=4058 RepID=A0ACB9ZKD7_CATRO|nr:hypothetical protein M9H77_34147 [Catharanthus roseus]